jgi:hypothetical protein
MGASKVDPCLEDCTINTYGFNLRQGQGLILRRKPWFWLFQFGPFFRDHNLVVIAQNVALRGTIWRCVSGFVTPDEKNRATKARLSPTVVLY